jgi:hypothetical protein
MSIQTDDVGKRGVIRWADGTTRAEGKIIAHSMVPSVLIETDDGERVWWRHDMGDILADPPPFRMTDDAAIAAHIAAHIAARSSDDDA